MLQFLRRPTADYMKKNMILLFLYGFAASNAPLLSYFNLPGISKEFDLEYSINYTEKATHKNEQL